MPRDGSGVYTLPAGNPVVSGTVISAGGWANPTMSDIGTEVTNSLDRQGRGGMTAALKLFDGVVATPGLGFANEPGSGWYRPGAGTIAITVLGTEVARAISGALLVNTTSFPYANVKLAVKIGTEGTTINESNGIAVQRNGNDSHLFFGYNTTPDAFVLGATFSATGAYKPIAFATSDTERMRIDTSGNVIVGASTRSGIGSGNDLFSVRGPIGFGDGTASAAQLNGNSTTFMEIVNRGVGGLRFFTNAGATVAGWVDTAGRWGIGSGQSPTSGYDLTIAGATFAKGVAIVASKAANTSRNTTTTFTDDPDLIIALPAGRYDFEVNCWISCGVGGNANGWKAQMNFTGTKASPDSHVAQSFNSSITGGTPFTIGGQITMTNVSSSGTQPTEMVKITGEIIVSVAGNLSIQWAQNSSGAQALQMWAGSSIKATRTA